VASAGLKRLGKFPVCLDSGFVKKGREDCFRFLSEALLFFFLEFLLFFDRILPRLILGEPS
jgi:hypothetical protein